MVLQVLHDEQIPSSCLVYTYCLMPDHLHFLVRPSENRSSVIQYVQRVKGRTTRMSWALGWQGKLWQERFYDHIIRSDENLAMVSQYILDNPFRKGLVIPDGVWPWAGIMNPPETIFG
jgi:putative transposase